MKKMSEYREHLANMFVNALEEEGLNWKKGWKNNDAPCNGVSNVPYRGVNRFNLTMTAIINGYKDPRWCTFKQIIDNGWKLAKGTRGTQIEYWLPILEETNKPVTWQVINSLKVDDPNVLYRVVPQYYYVFNADRISGMPEREVVINVDIKIEDIVPKISKNMGVEILNDSTSAYYSPSNDKVHLPKVESFLSSYDYYATAMHELAHASGASTRLDRDLSSTFGTPSYAFEELVAEMSATFMSEHLPYELPEEHLDNHKAYISSWAQNIKDDPDYLINAIRKADECATYLEEKAEINLEATKESAVTDKLSISEHDKTVLNLKSLGLDIVSNTSLADTICVKSSDTDKELLFNDWKEVDTLINNVYSIVDNYSLDMIKEQRLDILQAFDNTIDVNVIDIAFHNYDNLIVARDKSLFDKTCNLSWQETYLKMYQNQEFQKYLINVKQVDRARGDIHIFQDKDNPDKNYIGKKVEVNDKKKVQSLSPAMSLKDAQDKLKSMVEHKDKSIVKNKAISVGLEK